MTSYAAKLTQIIVPEIELVRAKLSDSLEFISQESYRLDDEETNPSRRGMRIGWILPPGVADVIRLTMRLHDADLHTALVAIAAQSGLALHVNESGVFLMPKNVFDALIPPPRPRAPHTSPAHPSGPADAAAELIPGLPPGRDDGALGIAQPLPVRSWWKNILCRFSRAWTRARATAKKC